MIKHDENCFKKYRACRYNTGFVDKSADFELVDTLRYRWKALKFMYIFYRYENLVGHPHTSQFKKIC